MSDLEAAAFYADPEHLQAAGPGRGRHGRALTKHVPVRFGPELIEAVQALADEDGITVSSWIRNVVEREVRHRSVPQTLVYFSHPMEWQQLPRSMGTMVTFAAPRQDVSPIFEIAVSSRRH